MARQPILVDRRTQQSDHVLRRQTPACAHDRHVAGSQRPDRAPVRDEANLPDYARRRDDDVAGAKDVIFRLAHLVPAVEEQGRRPNSRVPDVSHAKQPACGTLWRTSFRGEAAFVRQSLADLGDGIQTFDFHRRVCRDDSFQFGLQRVASGSLCH